MKFLLWLCLSLTFVSIPKQGRAERPVSACAALTQQYHEALRDALAERALPNDHPPTWLQAPACRHMAQLAEEIRTGAACASGTDGGPHGSCCPVVRSYTYAQEDCQAVPARCELDRGPANLRLAAVLHRLWATRCAYPAADAASGAPDLPMEAHVAAACWDMLAAPTEGHLPPPVADCQAMAAVAKQQRIASSQQEAYLQHRDAPECQAYDGARRGLDDSGCAAEAPADGESERCVNLRAEASYHGPYCAHLPEACLAQTTQAWQVRLQAEHVLREAGCVGG